MPHNHSDRPARYHTFLLTLWAEAGSEPEWRCSLENPHTGTRTGFASLDELARYLRAWTSEARPGPQPHSAEIDP
jgi:hypothetical protein